MTIGWIFILSVNKNKWFPIIINYCHLLETFFIGPNPLHILHIEGSD
jgi:hypothetical protein